MRICSINSYNCGTPRKTLSANRMQSNNVAQNSVNFTGDNKPSSNKAKSAVIGICMLPLAIGGLSSCETETDAYLYTHGESSMTTSGSTYVSCPDSINKWRGEFVRPIPLDSLYKNFGNWGLVDGDINDPKSDRNIIHYDITREWEENDREIGDMNYIQSNRDRKVLVYDTEVQDYKGRHKYFGKSVIRIPEGDFTVTTSDGKVLNSPKGFFVESWRTNDDRKGADFTSCTPLTRNFCVTVGDSLKVAKQVEGNNFQLTGNVAKGYLGANTLLLDNLIGKYGTDDHLTNVSLKAVNDSVLRENFVKAMDIFNTTK